MTEQEPSRPATPLALLVVEDDPEQARLLVRWLESTGSYEIRHAANGSEAETLIRGREWDLIVTDIELPGLTGLDLLRISKDVLPYTSTLLITAHEKIEYALEAIRGRADDFLIKPLTREPFLAKVRTLADKAIAERRRRRQVVLAIGAHPDDVEIGCGGILLRHRSQGDVVVVLTLSGGEHGGLVSERTQEAHRAAEILGARLHLDALEDTRISEGTETISVIQALINDVHPTVIYTHSLHDGHQDHRSVHRATIVAARGIASLFCYQAPSTSIDFRPTRFIEVAEFMDRKVASINAYRSQVAKRPYLRESLLRATGEYWGRFAGYGVVEPLEVIRES